MKFLRSVIFTFAFFFLTISPLFAQGCQYNCDVNCKDISMCPHPDYDATCTETSTCNSGYAICSCEYNGGGGGGNGGGGDLSTNIDAQAKSFFAYQSFDKFLPNLLQLALILGAVAAFAFLIWGAIDYIISGGNQERVKTAKTMIGNALAGLAILAAVWVIWRLITYFLGLSPTIKGPFDIKLPTP
ncbi:hypothetical protein KKE48_03090 [Patescibacteria group bacterium]|nr:hypothetical protein [Patescibacteria group bacterium]MBU1499827.1 hypothetical protein [Patescibacteria group bacterium]